MQQPINALPDNILTESVLDLKDIHLPEQISNFPVAYGWWLLMALIILIVVVVIIKMRKIIKRQQVKKQALEQLKSNKEMTTSDIIALLKWAAMHYFSRAELAKLFGDSLQQFLYSKLPVKYQQNFTDLSQQAFENQYSARSTTSIDSKLNQAAILWLRHALPPKTLPPENKNQVVSA
ncbi:MAG: DUF4381 domain-containing protein [Colwellia sp.]|nr:DUF4381 domain-containing protein [Colwellia sp.]